jgi:hypothetical protein
MANVKISNLTAATTPLAGTEVLPIVQSGATVKASIANVQTAVYPGGTANGVAYLNGSKVLTTGSALVFDGSNLGVGVTPSAWGSGYRAVMVNPSSAGPLALASAGDEGIISVNAYNNAGWKYVSTGIASTYYMQTGGTHRWYNAPSGTAGNAITFTQAMTLDASGNLGIGTTSPGGRLQLNSGAVDCSFRLRTTASGDGSGDGVDITLSTGNILYITNRENGATVFENNGSERARIFSGGGISVFSATTANDTIDSCNNQAAGTTYSTFIGRHSATTIATGTVSCRIYTNGNIVNTNNSYGPISDIKLKENIVDATPKLQDLMRVRIVNYNLKTDQTHKQIGVIAQELEQVFAGLVDDHPDMDEQGNSLGTTTKSVKMSVFTPILIKAIQEQQALIQTLTARITALESA